MSTILVLLAAGAYGYYEFSRGNADLAHSTPQITIFAQVLLAEYSKDEVAANKKYLNKIVNVEGKLKSIDKDHTNSLTLTLEANDPMASVTCQLDERHSRDTGRVKVGDKIKVTGICAGMLADIVLVRCSVCE